MLIFDGVDMGIFRFLFYYDINNNLKVQFKFIKIFFYNFDV